MQGIGKRYIFDKKGAIGQMKSQRYLPLSPLRVNWSAFVNSRFTQLLWVCTLSRVIKVYHKAHKLYKSG